VPKAEDEADLRAIERLLSPQAERAQFGLAELAAFRLFAMIETARWGDEPAKRSPAATARLEGLIFGAEDLAGDIGSGAHPGGVGGLLCAQRGGDGGGGLSACKRSTWSSPIFNDAVRAGSRKARGAAAWLHRQDLHPPESDAHRQPRLLAESGRGRSGRSGWWTAFAAQQAAGAGAFTFEGKMVDMPMLVVAHKVRPARSASIGWIISTSTAMPIVASSSLVPDNDPTLLLINAGMNQFKDLFLGLEKRDYNRATTSQKCMRVSGKHNDLENVGPSPRHHTFFEMLGNFSFGDYFKQRRHRFAWDLLVTQLGLPVERLWFTVYQDDDEAERLWIETGADPAACCALARRTTGGRWATPAPAAPAPKSTTTGATWTSRSRTASTRTTNTWRSGTWSLCSTTPKPGGELVPLPKPSVDTGAGLERLASILQGKDNNYDTDAFTPIMAASSSWPATATLSVRSTSTATAPSPTTPAPAPFMIGDGVLPGNEAANTCCA
jgi:hypothetical protein